MRESRVGYSFTMAQKEMARDRADGACEFPAEPCPLPNTNQVNHFTGIYVGKLLGVEQSTITDNDNNLMLCKPHQDDLDHQEHVLVDFLEHQGFRAPKANEPGGRSSHHKRVVRNTRTQRRRIRQH